MTLIFLPLYAKLIYTIRELQQFHLIVAEKAEGQKSCIEQPLFIIFLPQINSGNSTNRPKQLYIHYIKEQKYYE